MRFKLKNYTDDMWDFDMENQNEKETIGLTNLYLLKLYFVTRLNLEVSNKEFYKLVTELYDIKYDGRFDMELIEFINNKEYKVINIPTTEIFAYNRDFDGFRLSETKYTQSIVQLIVPKDFDINISKSINPKELKELLDRHDIYYLNTTSKQVNCGKVIDELFDNIWPTVKKKLLNTIDQKDNNSDIKVFGDNNVKEKIDMLPELIKSILKDPKLINEMFYNEWIQEKAIPYNTYYDENYYKDYKPTLNDCISFQENHKIIDEFANSNTENIDKNLFNFLVSKMRKYFSHPEVVEELEYEIRRQRDCMQEYFDDCGYQIQLNTFFKSEDDYKKYIKEYKILKRTSIIFND